MKSIFYLLPLLVFTSCVKSDSNTHIIAETTLQSKIVEDVSIDSFRPFPWNLVINPHEKSGNSDFDFIEIQVSIKNTSESRIIVRRVMIVSGEVQFKDIVIPKNQTSIVYEGTLLSYLLRNTEEINGSLRLWAEGAEKLEFEIAVNFLPYGEVSADPRTKVIIALHRTEPFL